MLFSTITIPCRGDRKAGPVALPGQILLLVFIMPKIANLVKGGDFQVFISLKIV
jgi:hypothetical protein